MNFFPSHISTASYCHIHILSNIFLYKYDTKSEEAVVVLGNLWHNSDIFLEKYKLFLSKYILQF